MVDTRPPPPDGAAGAVLKVGQPWMAGERFTIADITAFCAIEFARGLMKFKPGDEGLSALEAWRDRVAERPSARV